MRYKEFATTEAISRFMSQLLGTDVTSSWTKPEPGAEVEPSDKPTDSPTDTPTDKPSDKPTDSPISSKGEILPVKGPISSPFGRRASGMHLGTDFAVPIGTPVRAPQDGIVSRTGSDNQNGIYVEINSGRTVHLLLHLSKSKVTSGQQVKQGQVVALSGNTGHSTGPHLHWSKRIAGRPVDPMANVG